jgi:hypothetical protein
MEPNQPYQLSDVTSPTSNAPDHQKRGIKIVLIVAGVAVLLCLGGGIAVAIGGNTNTNKAATLPLVATTPDPTPADTEAAAEPEATDPTTRLTTPPAISAEQANANGAAEDYLNGQHFSRTGLIEQLGYEGYSTKVATRAVDSLHVDWNEQAVGVAKEYLSDQHFSHTGLIEQLKYDGFTAKQAAYGVKGAGL